MNLNADHIDFVIAAYAVSAIGLAGLIFYVLRK
jgi:hypothetical protein